MRHSPCVKLHVERKVEVLLRCFHPGLKRSDISTPRTLSISNLLHGSKWVVVSLLESYVLGSKIGKRVVVVRFIS